MSNKEISTDLLAKLATIKEDHLTIFRFSTHWKILGRIPNLDIGGEREKIRALKEYDSLRDALIDFLTEE